MGGKPVPCSDALDANDDGKLDIAEPVFTLNFLFLGGRRNPAPYPAPALDVTADGLDC